MKGTEENEFKILESITDVQNIIRCKLLWKCAKKTAKKRKNTSVEDRSRRHEQLNKWRESFMPGFSFSVLTFEQVVKNWWHEEIKWKKKHSISYNKESGINMLSYRLLNMFFQNINHCPFYTGNKKQNKHDQKDFYEENQKLFKKFLNLSIKTISSQKKFQQIIDIVPLLKQHKKINISESLYSAQHKLYGKDWAMAKGLLIGGGTGTVVSVFLGPVIGGYIGNLAGLSGAAATSYGLAFLGGGSLAAGGLGMAGGSAVLGLGFGIAGGVRGVKNSLKKTELDTLHTLQAQMLLPTLLAIGRVQFENGDKEIPYLIHKTVMKRCAEFNIRLNTLESQYDESIEKSIKSVKLSFKLYRKASDMSKSYNWTSGYNILQGIKSWAS